MKHSALRGSRLAAALALIFLAALTLRGLNYGQVFQHDGVRFQDGDSWYHMRSIRNLMHHFPHRSGFDPYSGFPQGQDVTTGPFFDLAVGSIAWIAGFGRPSAALVDDVGAWFPAVLGALFTVPVFFLGRALFSTAAGLFAAVLIACMPGNLLTVSRLGLPDHHVAEIFFSTLMLLFMVLALDRDRPAQYAILGGISFGCFLATRPAGGFLIAAVGAWALLQILIDYWRREGSGRISGVTLVVFLTGWLIFLPSEGLIWSDFTVLALSGGIAGIVFVAGLAWLLQSVSAPRWALLALLGAAAVVAVAGVFWRRPAEVVSLAHTVRRYLGNGPAMTVRELRPILTLNGRFAMSELWAQFGTCWIAALAALAWLAGGIFGTNRPSMNLLLVWSALMLGATLLQNRMAYFFAINAALLTGYLFGRLYESAPRGNRILTMAALALMFIAPNLPYAWGQMQVPAWESDEWVETLDWMRANTPEPFGDASAFDRYDPAPRPHEIFHYPPSAYGIMNWWDYGHLISAVGRRIPVSNGMQTHAVEAAQFFLATDPDEGRKMLRATGARYVIADATLPLATVEHMSSGNGAFRAMPTWANKPLEDYVAAYVQQGVDGSEKLITLFLPAYYQSMLARLYLFDGKAFTPDRTTSVIQYTDEPKPHRIVKTRIFETYDEALKYMRGHPGQQLILAGLNPFASCVPLEELQDMRLVFRSRGTPEDEEAPIKTIKIFEFSGQ